jgi:hypothetical protein
MLDLIGRIYSRQSCGTTTWYMIVYNAISEIHACNIAVDWCGAAEPADGPGDRGVHRVRPTRLAAL